MTRRVLLFLALLAITTACSSGSDSASSAQTLHVFAASSLTEAFGRLGAAFEAAHSNVHVEFNFAASSALAQQIAEGAPADVFVSADEANMQKVIDGGDATTSTVVARNRLAMLVEKGNPKGIHALADLARPGVVVVLCAPEVPCGKYGAAALARANVTVKAASLEENVKAVVTKVTLGEADAGIVYVTDVKAADATKTEGVPVDDADAPELQAVYPVAVLTGAKHAAAARAWVQFLTSAAGQRTLRSFGFR